MQCPFLHKMNVKFCDLWRSTMIPLSPGNMTSERCSGPDYTQCSLLQEACQEVLHQDHCPHLSVGDVHNCSAASFQKPLSVNQAAASRCTGDAHKYCQLFLAMKGTRLDQQAEADTAPGLDDDQDSSMVMPDPLAYAPNHMWLDPGDGQTCHVGVDAFFGRTLGRLDEIIYPRLGQGRRPVVRFRVNGVDLDLVFPNVMQVYETNPHLVSDPTEVVRDPYGRGWIFEGTPISAWDRKKQHPLEKGLLRGPDARSWMSDETDRLTGFVHEYLARQDGDSGILMQDGGRPRGHLAEVLDRPALVRLHGEFFSLRNGRTES